MPSLRKTFHCRPSDPKCAIPEHNWPPQPTVIIVGRRVGLRAHGSWRNGEGEIKERKGPRLGRVFTRITNYSFCCIYFISPYFVASHPRPSHLCQSHTPLYIPMKACTAFTLARHDNQIFPPYYYGLSSLMKNSALISAESNPPMAKQQNCQNVSKQHLLRP